MNTIGFRVRFQYLRQTYVTLLLVKGLNVTNFVSFDSFRDTDKIKNRTKC